MRVELNRRSRRPERHTYPQGVLKYADLIPEPARRGSHSASTFNCAPTRSIPKIAELQQTDDGFFRRGISGCYLDEMPHELHDRF